MNIIEKIDKYLGENRTELYRVSYDGRYDHTLMAKDEKDAIRQWDKSKTMSNKKKIMKFDYSKYTAKLVKEGCSKKPINEAGDKYKCDECGWVYDPAKTGKEFSEESSDYKCPKCGAGKSAFSKM